MLRLLHRFQRRRGGDRRSGRWEVTSRRRNSLWQRLTAPQLFVLSFALLVGLGTVGFMVLPGLYTGPGLTWGDALFTATSAVCVTGLIVVDTATFFTTAGQAYLLALIQLGGLGIVAFTSLIIVALGRRLSLRQEAITSAYADAAPTVRRDRLIRDVVAFTFGIEAVGALLLYVCWVDDFGWAGAAWPAFFHAVSAFCNAGFSTFSDSLMGAAQAPGILAVIMALVVVGGIGFLTLEEITVWSRAARRRGTPGRRRFRLSLHSRLVLATTAVLLVGGWAAFTVFEWHVSFDGMPTWAKVTNGLFLSVTARTAGFNTIDYGAARDSTNFLTVILMSIGGSPGSTAGGLKTTTVALIGLVALARMRGRTVTSAWSRSVPEETIQRAIGLFVMAFGIVTVVILLFSASEIPTPGQPAGRGDFLRYMFEAASAFNTVGLSMGVTAALTPLGKAATILLMFLGRVGPLTFAAALARPRREPVGGFRYAYEDVIVG